MRGTAYEKLLPPIVAKVRQEVFAWRGKGYPGTSRTSVTLLRSWFETDHLTENADGSLSTFRYYFAQREAVETTIWLYEVRAARDKYDLLRFDASGAVSSGMFAEDWPRYVLKMATGAGKTKVLSLLIAWSFFHKLYEADKDLRHWRRALQITNHDDPASTCRRTANHSHARQLVSGRSRPKPRANTNSSPASRRGN